MGICRRRAVGPAVVVMVSLIAGCSGSSSPGVTSAATSPTSSGPPLSSSAQATSTTSHPVEPTTTSTGSTTNSGAPTTAGASAYLRQARAILPGQSDKHLLAFANEVCTVLHQGSRHDAVGQLAGQIGDAGTANQLVTAASQTYCRRP